MKEEHEILPDYLMNRYLFLPGGLKSTHFLSHFLEVLQVGQNSMGNKEIFDLKNNFFKLIDFVYTELFVRFQTLVESIIQSIIFLNK